MGVIPNVFVAFVEVGIFVVVGVNFFVGFVVVEVNFFVGFVVVVVRGFPA